jgi:hypothetical protein
MPTQTLTATIKLKIYYDAPQDRRDCLASVRGYLREGLGRGVSGRYLWELKTGSVTDSKYPDRFTDGGINVQNLIGIK